MPRAAFVPPELTHRPFTLEEARRAGLARWHLETSAFRRLGPRLYAWSGLGDSPHVRLAAARSRLPTSMVFSGLTAAWLHGLDVEPCDPIDATVGPRVGVSARTGIRLRRATLDLADVMSRGGFDFTTIVKTLLDLCNDLTLTEIVVLADAATHLGLTTIAKLHGYAIRATGRPGITAFRRAIELTEPKAESPMESRLRMVLVSAGLPRPLVQAPLYDRNGGFLARPDLYYADRKLGIEYDGGVHKTSLVEDNRRQNRLLAEGIRLLRFTASDVYGWPQRVVDDVRLLLERVENPPVPAAAGFRTGP